MKYTNFYEWFKTQDFGMLVPGTSNLMLEAWDAAVNNMPTFNGAKEIAKLNELRRKAAIGEKILELLTTLKDAMKIDCTCDNARIKHGCPCICVKAGAVLQATKELGAYLQKLRKELK